LEWYDPEAITTQDGYLVITLSQKDTHSLNYQGGEYWMINDVSELFFQMLVRCPISKLLIPVLNRHDINMASTHLADIG
jgi:hypothetical protein